MTRDYDDLMKLLHLAGVRRFSEIRIAHRRWDIRVTPSGYKIWSPRPMTQRHEPGSFQSTLGSATHGDVIFLFKRYKLKLVGVTMNSQLPTSCDEYLSAADLGGKGCFISIEPLYVAPVDQEDHDEYDQDEDLEDGEASDSHKAVRFDESLTVIEQIRSAQSSRLGFNLAHDELSAGRKNGEWIRWIFPSLSGAVVSGERGRYRLTGPADAVQLLRDAELGVNYLKSVSLVWAQIVVSGLAPSELMGSDADSDELRSSLELFLESWEMLNAEEKELPEMQEFSLRARQLLEFINPLL